MNSTSDWITALTGVAGAGVGAVAHNLWADLKAYIRTHRAVVEARADAVLNEGIDLVVGTESNEAADVSAASAQKTGDQEAAAEQASAAKTPSLTDNTTSNFPLAG